MEVRANSEPFKQIVIWLFDSIKGHQINSSQTIPASLKFLSSNVKEGKVCFGQHMITVKTYHRTMFILKKRSASVKYFCSHMSEVLLTTSIYAHFYHYLVINKPSSILQRYQSSHLFITQLSKCYEMLCNWTPQSNLINSTMLTHKIAGDYTCITNSSWQLSTVDHFRHNYYLQRFPCKLNSQFSGNSWEF